ncbi:alpha/beta hydrolase [Virgibacillus ndiopensis]|uniref:alpha/beta hydrolase n=1 Tax=Virgibacillus ndiopensis TaxID=2004408 RepID=UPI000C080DC2|nr:alpha/beta hydrolase [Virgibacillus ndiopensis]
MTDKTTLDYINYEYIKCQNENAETVILVHGIGLDMTIWDEILPLLQSQYHVLRYDLPCHGKSNQINDISISWGVLLDQFEILLQKLSITKAHFIGHAGGGNLGIEAALHLKGYLQSLILISTPIFVPKEFGKEESAKRLQLRNSTMEEIAGLLSQNLVYPATKEKIDYLHAMYGRTTVSVYSDYFELVSNTVLNYAFDRIQQIETPMMMLTGEHDILYPPQMQMVNMGYMPDVRFLIVPDASNLIMIDQPETFMRLFRQFMKKINAIQPESPYSNTYSKPLNEKLRAIFDSGIEQNDSQHVIKLNIVDRFQVMINGQKVEGKWNQRKAKQLMTYIALHKSVTREKLVDIFWPDYDMDKARNHLRVALNHIKGIIERHTGESIGNYVSIKRDSIEMKAHVKIDVTDLIDEIRSFVKEPEKVKDILDYLHALPDTLFPSFYDDWIIELRTSIEDNIINSCEDILAGNPSDEQAMEALKIIIKYNPGDDHYSEKLLSLIRKAERR